MGRLSGPGKVWALTAVMSVVVVVSAFGLRDLGSMLESAPWAWLLLIPGIWLAEVTVVHLEFRRDAHSFSMSEIPLTLGLLFVSPLQLLAAQVIGMTLAFSVVRKQPVLKKTFNVAQFSLQAVVAIVVFRLATNDANLFTTRPWLAALAGTLTAMMLANILINTAIRLTSGPIKRAEVAQVLGLSTLATTMNTSLGLVIATVFFVTPNAAWIALIPPASLFFAYRAYAAQRAERKRLQSLYEATQELHRSPRIDKALLAAAEHGRSMLEAEVCEIVILPEGPEPLAYRTRVSVDGDAEPMEPMPIDQLGSTWMRAIESAESQLEPHLAEAAEFKGTIVAPLVGESGVIGLVLVANRLGDVSVFNENDLKLLETLASQVSVSLQNGRLEDSLSELTELKEELRHKASHDGLTGLANRHLFSERLDRAMRASASRRDSVAVMFVDLDDFKGINDRLGHAAGDEVLIAAAQRLQSCCRPKDLVGRLGGDEFAILLDGLEDDAAAQRVAERVIEVMAQPLIIKGQEVGTHASVGVAFARPGHTPEDLIHHADEAMYTAKRTLKGSFQIFGRSMTAEVAERIEIRKELAKAIENNHLYLVYQPIVDLVTGAPISMEALVRWQHSQRGVIMPDQFVPFAEETGLIVPLGRWVMQEAARAAAEWRNQHRLDLAVNINVSPRQLIGGDLVSDLEAILEETGLEPEAMVVELTENLAMQASESTIKRLKEMGVAISVDDFGTGYSSLARLDRLPIDSIKIDESFIRRMREGSAPLLRSILTIGRELGVDTIAEGVETADDAQDLRAMGARLGQGFFLGRPMPVEEVPAFVRHGAAVAVGAG